MNGNIDKRRKDGSDREAHLFLIHAASVHDGAAMPHHSL